MRLGQSFDMLVDLGVAPENIYVGHADFAEFEENAHICKSGGHVLFTVWGVGYMIPVDLVYERFAELVRAGYVENALMSVDFAILVLDPAEPMHLSWTLCGIEGRTHSYLFRTVIPKLKESYGLSDEEIRIITEDNPALGLYPRLRSGGHDLHELHALMAPRPFLVSGGSEDPPERWQALNRTIEVNRVLGFEDRVGMTNRPEHAPNAESNEVIYAFFEYFLGPVATSDR